MARRLEAFTLVEMLIVVTILGILAVTVVPRFADSSQEARDAALCSNIRLLRNQIDLYRAQHNDRGPERNENNGFDVANFVSRLTGRTTPSGKLDPNGPLGPYLSRWPANPFCDPSVAEKIQFSVHTSPPRRGLSGWFYSVTTGLLYANSVKGGESFDP
ncbi:MAG: type II secretion system protein [Planctomycetes bacterium]|nr:type II secretion system protein [Planctomycetota bacterium]